MLRHYFITALRQLMAKTQSLLCLLVCLHAARNSLLCRGFALGGQPSRRRACLTPSAASPEPREGVSHASSTGNQPTMSLRGLKAWFGRGAAEDEDETMVRDPNV